MNKQLVYKQLVDGTWAGNDGTKINFVFIHDDSDFPIYQLIDQRGNIIATSEISISDIVPSALLFNYNQRTGRHIRSEINFKLVPELFPPGTIVEVESTMYENGVIPLTVDYVEQNGIRSFCMVMKEQRVIRFGHDKGGMEPYRFNIINVRKIIKRGSGKTVIKRDEKIDTVDSVIEQAETSQGWVTQQYPPARKGEVMWCIDDHWIAAAIQSVPGNEGRYVRPERLIPVVSNAGFSRWVKTIDHFGIPYQIYAIDKRKFKKWVQKYSHLVLNTLDADENIEMRYYLADD